MKSLRLAISLLFLFPAYAISQELKPGVIISQENADAVKELVPSAVLKRIGTGEYSLRIGELKPESLSSVYSEAFYQASEENKGKYSLDDAGGLIDVSTGKRTTPGPGLPFPEIDPEEPEAGARIVWNFLATEYQSNSQEIMWILRTYKGRSIEVEVVARQARLPYDFRSTPIKIEKGITYKELGLYLAPADLFGTVSLTWRWHDPSKWDSTWMYVPSMRRVRRTTAANRSDSVGATDYMMDDVNGYAGKVEFFKWKLLEAKDMLVAFIPDDSQGSIATFPRKCEPYKRKGEKAFIQPRFKTTWGYEEEEPMHAPWWPLSVIWVKRPVYILEGTSKDPYYSQGKAHLIIDRETFRIFMKLGWDRAGNYWRTQVMTQGYYLSPDGKISAPTAEISCLIDEKRNRASTSDRTAPEVVPTIFNIDIDQGLFSISNFLNYGK